MLVCHIILTMGALVWADTETMKTSIKIPVETKNISTGLIVTGPPVQGIEIQVTGPVEAIQSLPGTKLNFDLDLSGKGIGIHIIAVSADLIKLPKGITIVKLNTPSITIRIDREIKKEVAVAVVIDGKPAPGYQTAGVQIEPGKVVLRGPQMVLKGIEKISTNPIDCTDASESFKKKIALNLPENVSKLLPTDPILAHVHIEEMLISRTFEKLKVTGHNSKHSFSITPPVIRIEVKGPYSIVNDLENCPEFEIYIDLKNLDPGVYVRRATIALPVTTVLLGVSPEIFTVKIGG